MKWLQALALCVAISIAAVASAGAASIPKTESFAARAALGQVGVPFVWGGDSPARGFDSSGLVVWAYAQAGVRGLPHFSGDLWTRGVHVARHGLRAGDLVFFDKAGHVGIYVGHGDFVHAPGSGRSVRVAHLAGAYSERYTGAVRL
jgi:cell wall-associated NlpC family hydrolase